MRKLIVCAMFLCMGLMGMKVMAAYPTQEVFESTLKEAKEKGQQYKIAKITFGLKAAQAQPKTWEELEALREEVQKQFPKSEEHLKYYSVIVWYHFAKRGRTPEEVEFLFPIAMERKVHLVAKSLVMRSNVSKAEKAKRMCEICCRSFFSATAKSSLVYTLTLLPELPAAEAKEALQKMNRIWSPKLVSEKGKGWDEVVAMVRTALETY